MAEQARDEIEFDIDNPETWPSDVHGLSALAQPQPETTTAEPAAAETETTTAAAPQTAAAAATPTPEETAEPRILTADGKHTIPFDALREARERAKAAEERARALEEQLAQAAAPAATGNPAAASAETAPSLEDRYRALYDRWQKTKDTDEELAEVIAGSLQAMAAQLEQARELADLKAVVGRQQRSAQAAEQAQVQAAVAADPLLAELLEDATWGPRLVETERALAADPQSRYAQAADWPARFRVVVEAAQAIYGPAPQMTPVQPLAAAPAGNAPTPKPAPVVKPAAVPPSMSALTGGVVEPGTADEVAQLESMSPGQLRAFMSKAAAAGTLNDLIKRVT